MTRLQPDLWQTARRSAGMVNTHAYVLTHPDGNVLLYNTDNDDDLQRMEALGGIRYQLLSHRDEAGPSLKRIRDRFRSTLCCSRREAPAVAEHAAVDLAFDDGDHRLGDIEVIATPGHTAGSLCFRYASPHGKAYLFTGDTMFPWNGKWATLVLADAGGSEAALAASLARLRGLAPDLVMSSGFVGSVGLVDITQRDEWDAAIDAEIHRLKGTS